MKPRSAKRSSVARVGDTAELRARLHEAEERLRALEERHELAMGAIRESVYDWDIARDAFSVSKSMQAMLGLPPEQLSLDAWQQRVHAEDFPRFRDATIAHLKGETERFECDYRYRAGDGAWRWARTHGLALRNAEGRAVRMVGSTGDITELKRAEEALRATEERYALATAAAVEGIYEWKIPESELYLTEKAKAFFALSDDALTPAAWNKRVHAEDYPRYRAAIVEHFKGRSPHLELEYRIADGAGGYKWVLERGMALRDANGRAVRMVGALSDITERKRAELELRRARDEATEALARQTAVSEILRIIASSPADVLPMLDAVAERAVKLCESAEAAIFLPEAGRLRFAAGCQTGQTFQPGETIAITRGSVVARAFLDCDTVHVEDLAAAAPEEFEQALRYQRRFGHRSILAVPLLLEGRSIGVIALWRFEVRAFALEHIALVRTFADQAAIAIENVRLFNETKEALHRQTVTAEILKVIASSPSDVQPVFDAIVKHAGRLAGGCSVNVSRLVGDELHLAAYTPVSPSADATLKNAFPVHIGEVRTITEAVRKKASFFVSDFETDPNVSAKSRELMRARGFRSTLYVPILHNEVVHGLMHVSKVEPGPFSPQWIQLLETFADQAVIAIENVRLFNETKEALERETATAEILRVISSTPTDTEPVFDAIVQSGLRVFSGTGVGIALVQGDRVRIVSAGGALSAVATQVDMPLSDESTTGTAIVHATVVNTRDTEAADAPRYARANGRLLGFRSIAAAPMLREGVAIGAIGVTLEDPGGLSERHLDLLKTFADQAVIAIENVRLFNETREALERQTATSEILTSISRSMSDAQPVFDAIARNVTRFLGTTYAVVQLVREGMIYMAAFHGFPGFERIAESFPRPIDDRSLSGLVVRSRAVFQLTPIVGNPQAPTLTEQNARDFGYDSIIVAPMLRGEQVIGVIATAHRDALPFEAKHIELIKTFAAQAVIAVENARLFNETKEALEQQKASGEVLGAIGSSIADTAPVFEKILESCQRLFQGYLVGLTMVGDDGRVHMKAYQGPRKAEMAQIYPLPLSRDSGTGCAILDRAVAHYPDIEAQGVPDGVRIGARVLGFRSIIFAPLLAEGQGIGALWVGRLPAGAFSDQQIALLKTFADQAVIAIQNARLFNETKEALERQTATSEVLKVISQTRIDLQPVLETVLENARRLCDADRVLILRPDASGDYVPVAARISNDASTNVDALTQRPIKLDRSTAAGRALLERGAVHIPDVLADAEYKRTDLAVSGGFRTALSVPMLRDGEPIGAMTLTRAGPPRPFSQKQIELVTTFADQAVIAIENVRLFNETTEALEQLKASAEILRVISSSVEDARPVFDTILESCQRLFEGRLVAITTAGDDGAVHLAAYEGPGREQFEAHFPIPLTTESASGVAILERRVVHYLDSQADDVPEYARRGAQITGTRSVILAPMLWEDKGIGAISVGRAFVRPFSEKEIALLETFADQAVIAIQNARLFREIKEKSTQLEIANRHKSEFLANMSHELRTPLNAIIGFTRIVMRRSKEQLEPKQYENLEKILSSGQHLLQLINAILDLSKVEAGRVEVNAAELALAPVLEQCVKTVEPLVKAPAVRLVREFDGGLPQVYLDEAKLRQIVINLLSNAVKFTESGSVRVAAKANGESFAVAVADTGIGIPADKLEHVFDEFAQADARSTRVYGGTGLGLTIARRLARLMGGDISVESAPGAGSTFTLTLPVRYHA